MRPEQRGLWQMSSDILSALPAAAAEVTRIEAAAKAFKTPCGDGRMSWRVWGDGPPLVLLHGDFGSWTHWLRNVSRLAAYFRVIVPDMPGYGDSDRSEEHTSELQSLMRISYAVFCLKKKKKN